MTADQKPECKECNVMQPTYSPQINIHSNQPEIRRLEWQ